MVSGDERGPESMKAKIAVIGAVYWGKNLFRNFDSLGALGAICDSDKNTLNEFASLYPKVDTIDDYHTLLSDASFEAIAIASPAETHYRMVKEFLLADKHVFVEKPLALHEEEGIELNELAGERNRVLMVGHLLQYHPAVVKLKQLVSEGELGKIQYISEYIETKKHELEEFNLATKVDNASLVNVRRMTNIGTFRAYVKAYLQNHPMINKDMTFLIRQLPPTEHGLPIEIYVFSKDQVWANYEAIQADIFDHVLAVVPEFDLRVYQNPTGADFRVLNQVT